MGSAESDHLNSMLSSKEAYQQYYGFIHNLVDQQNIHAIETTIEKIQEALKDPNKPPQSKILAVRLARELITTGSYAYFILLSTRVLPLLVFSVESKKDQAGGTTNQSLMGSPGSKVVPKKTSSDDFLRIALETIMAVAIWLPINPYQSQNFPSLFRLEYQRMIYDDQVFPERFGFVNEHESDKCRQSYKLKIPRRLDYVEQLASHLKKRFKEYLSRGSPLQYRRLAMNILWTGDNHFCTYLIELCCKVISDPTATEFKRMNALDFLEDVFGIADVQCLEEIKAKAVPCMLEYIFPIDFKQNKYLPSPKFLNSNLRNRCIWLLAVWTKRMRQFPIINRSLYEVVYEKISTFQYVTDPAKLQRQEEVTAIMEQNIKYRRPINEAKMSSCMIPPEIDVCTNLLKGYNQTPGAAGYPFRSDVTRNSFVPTHQVMSLKPQSLPSIAIVGDTHVPFTMTSSRVLMQHPRFEQRTSRVVVAGQMSSDRSSRVVLPRPNELPSASASIQAASEMGARSQSAVPRVVSTGMASTSRDGGISAIIRTQNPFRGASQMGTTNRSETERGSIRTKEASIHQPSIISQMPKQLSLKYSYNQDPPKLTDFAPGQSLRPQSSIKLLPVHSPEFNPFAALAVPQPQQIQILQVQTPLAYNSQGYPYSQNSQGYPNPIPVPQQIPMGLSLQSSGKFPNNAIPPSPNNYPMRPMSSPPQLSDSFSPRGNFNGGTSPRVIVNSFGSDVNNSQLRVVENTSPQAMQIHRSIPLIESQPYIEPIQQPQVHVIPAQHTTQSAQPAYVSVNSNVSNDISPNVESAEYATMRNQPTMDLNLRETIREKPMVPATTEQVIVFDQEVNQQEPSGDVSHFRRLESLQSERQLFNDTYNYQVNSLMQMSIVQDNASEVENEFENDDISTVYQSVQKAAFAFDNAKLQQISLMSAEKSKLKGASSVTPKGASRLGDDKLRHKDNLRPCNPLSQHMTKIKRVLVSSSQQQLANPASLYGIGIADPQTNSANELPSAVRMSYQNKIRALEQQLKLRMQKEEEYEEEIGKLAGTIRQNNVLEERKPARRSSMKFFQIQNHTDKTKLKGYTSHRRVPSEQDNKITNSNVQVAAISKPIIGWSSIGVKRLLVRSKDLLLSRSNIEVGYLWQLPSQRLQLLLYYTFYGEPASEVTSVFESPDIVVQHRPIINGISVRADQQIKQEVNLKLVRIENVCRPILHLSYRQGRQVCRESIELPVTLFRFIRHAPIFSEELHRLFENQQEGMLYSKNINSVDRFFVNIPEALKELVPELTIVRGGDRSLRDTPNSRTKTLYGWKASLHQQEVVVRLTVHHNHSVTADVLPIGSSTKLATVYLEILSNLLRED